MCHTEQMFTSVHVKNASNETDTALDSDKRRNGDQRFIWRDMVQEDTESSDMAWEDVCLKTLDKEELKKWTAQ